MATRKARLSEINDKLGEASNHLAGKTDDAALQAHLAAMEAHDKWQHISKSFDKLAQKKQAARQKLNLITPHCKATLLKWMLTTSWSNGE